MNTYQIKTSTITFEVTAEDSDMACMAADEEIQRRGMPIESQRAELVLLDGDNSLSLGTFSLTGFEVPTTWVGISELRKDLLAAAKADSASNWHLPVIRSRGAVLVAEDTEGKTLIASGDDWAMPKTFKEFKTTLMTIKRLNPTAARVFLHIGCDAAESVRAMNDGEYTPWAGEAQAVVHVFPE
ncbi:TPA: hypothetical protein ACSCYS_004532 [Aeromonas veronii]|nr:hypothetical protein [Aeromonas veronii]